MLKSPDDETPPRHLGWSLSSLRQLCMLIFVSFREIPARQVLLAIFCTGAVSAILLFARLKPVRAPPPTVFFAGLPISGKLDDAKRAGFDDCFATDAVHMRCRRHAVTVGKTGPYEAAVDLEGGQGEGGFDQLVIWHNRDHYAVYDIADALERVGWKYCYTATVAGRTKLYTPVRVLSYASLWI